MILTVMKLGELWENLCDNQRHQCKSNLDEKDVSPGQINTVLHEISRLYVQIAICCSNSSTLINYSNEIFRKSLFCFVTLIRVIYVFS